MLTQSSGKIYDIKLSQDQHLLVVSSELATIVYEAKNGLSY